MESFKFRTLIAKHFGANLAGRRQGQIFATAKHETNNMLYITLKRAGNSLAQNGERNINSTQPSRIVWEN